MELMSRDYLPKHADARASWLTNFAAVLDTGDNAAALGVTPEQVKEIQSGSTWYGYMAMRYIPYVRAFNESMSDVLASLDSDDDARPLEKPVFEAPETPPGLPAATSGVMKRVVDLIEGTILPSENLTPGLRDQLGLNVRK